MADLPGPGPRPAGPVRINAAVTTKSSAPQSPALLTLHFKCANPERLEGENRGQISDLRPTLIWCKSHWRDRRKTLIKTAVKFILDFSNILLQKIIFADYIVWLYTLLSRWHIKLWWWHRLRNNIVVTSVSEKNETKIYLVISPIRLGRFLIKHDI